MNLAAWGVPNASKRGTKSEVAHKWRLANYYSRHRRIGANCSSTLVASIVQDYLAWL